MDTGTNGMSELMARGAQLLAEGDHAEALKAFDGALAVETTRRQALLGKMRALRALGRDAEALQVGRWALVHADQADTPLLCAQALHALRRDEDALWLAERACWLSPHDMTAHTTRGDILFGLARDDEAISAYEQALRASSENADEDMTAVRDALAAARERADRRAARLEVLARERADHPEDEAFWNDVAEWLRDLSYDDIADAVSGESSREQRCAAAPALVEGMSDATLNHYPDSVLKRCELALAIDPTLAHALYCRAKVFFERGEHAEALDMVTRIPDTLTVFHSEGWRTRGAISRANGRLSSALECYERALAYGPWMESWRREQAALLSQMGRGEEARAPLAMAELFSGLKLIALGRGASSPQQYETALACLDRAAELDPTQRFARAEAAAALVFLGRLEEARARLDEALRTHPEDVSLLAVKGQALLAEGQPESALEIFEQALALAETNRLWTGAATAFVRLGRDEEALAAVERALERDDEDEAAWALRGDLFERAGRYDEALECFEAALAWDDLLSLEDHIELEVIELCTAGVRHKQTLDTEGHVELYRAKIALARRLGREKDAESAQATVDAYEMRLYMKLARESYDEGRFEDAAKECRLAITHFGLWKEGWLLLGDALGHLGREDEALDAYKGAMRASAGAIQEVANRANERTTAKEYPFALRLVDAALESWQDQRRWFHLSSLIPVNTMEAYMYNAKCKIFCETGRLEEALWCGERAVELDPKMQYAWRNKGRALSQLRLWDESARDFRRALDLSDTEAYDWHSLAYALFKAGDGEQALAAIDRAIALDPSPSVVGTKGQIYLKLGQPEEALVWLDRALEADPTDREHWAEKAAALHALGREDESRSAAARAE